MGLSALLEGAYRRLRQHGRVIAGRLLGTTTNQDSRYKAVMDLAEWGLFCRAEVNALSQLLRDRLKITSAEYEQVLLENLTHLANQMQAQFPELEYTTTGYTVKDVHAWTERMKREGWPP